MAIQAQGNRFVAGQGQTPTVPPGALIAIDFDSNLAPGVNLPTTVALAVNDEIRLCFIPENATIEGYDISIARLESGAAGVVVSLRDGAGNIFQAGVTAGQAGGKITNANSAVNVIGVPQVYTKAQAFMTLVVTTAATAAAAAAARVSGVFYVRKA